MDYTDNELIQKAKQLSRDKSINEDAREIIWLVASLAQDRTNDLRFLISQISALASHAVRNAEINCVSLEDYGKLKSR